MLARAELNEPNRFDPMRIHDLVRAAENKYNRLLTILVLAYLMSPFVLEQSLGSLIGFFVCLGAIIVVVYQVQYSQWLLRSYLGLVGLTLVLRIGSHPSIMPNATSWFAILSTLIFMVFLALSIYLILRELALVERVTADIVKGGICVYLLLGFFWTAIYSIIYSLDAQAFTAPSTPLTQADLTHFSFTTLATVGYGDIAPVSDVARVLANLEGMVGVIYPTVFIARLVSLYK